MKKDKAIDWAMYMLWKYYSNKKRAAKWCKKLTVLGKITPGKMPPGKTLPGKLPPGSLFPRKNTPRKIDPQENWTPENWPPKIILWPKIKVNFSQYILIFNNNLFIKFFYDCLFPYTNIFWFWAKYRYVTKNVRQLVRIEEKLPHVMEYLIGENFVTFNFRQF